MSARAIASQKAKRVSGGTTQSPISMSLSSDKPTDENQKTKLTISEAIYMLDNKISVIESTLEEKVCTVQPEVNKSQTTDAYEERLSKFEKENSLLKLKISQLESSIPSIRSSLQTLDTKATAYDSKLVDIEEMQKLVNKMSSQLLGK